MTGNLLPSAGANTSLIEIYEQVLQDLLPTPSGQIFQTLCEADGMLLEPNIPYMETNLIFLAESLAGSSDEKSEKIEWKNLCKIEYKIKFKIKFIDDRYTNLNLQWIKVGYFLKYVLQDTALRVAQGLTAGFRYIYDLTTQGPVAATKDWSRRGYEQSEIAKRARTVIEFNKSKIHTYMIQMTIQDLLEGLNEQAAQQMTKFTLKYRSFLLEYDTFYREYGGFLLKTDEQTENLPDSVDLVQASGAELLETVFDGERTPE